jgi:hypothetical protein
MAPCPWSEYTPATIHFCEARLCAWVVEPSNAWSNLGFVIWGIVILATLPRRAPLVLIGVVSILLGIGSFGLHGTGTRWGELIDVGSMYGLSALGVISVARRLWGLGSAQVIGGFIAIVVVSVAQMIALHNNGIVMFGVQMALAILGELHLYRRGDRADGYRDLKLVVACFLTAFLIWNLDKSGVLCDPDNHLVTGHAVWHVLTATSVYFFARHQARLMGASAAA